MMHGLLSSGRHLLSLLATPSELPLPQSAMKAQSIQLLSEEEGSGATRKPSIHRGKFRQTGQNLPNLKFKKLCHMFLHFYFFSLKQWEKKIFCLPHTKQFSFFLIHVNCDTSHHSSFPRYISKIFTGCHKNTYITEYIF